jgi:hypothetical protein
MTDAQASEAARLLARARWGDTGLRHAVSVVVERRDELDEALKAQLREVTGHAPGDAEGDR